MSAKEITKDPNMLQVRRSIILSIIINIEREMH